MASQNVIVFMPDSLSQTAIDHAKDNHVTFPNLNRLSSHGASFQNCIVQNPVCTPSRCSLFTGKYVHNTAHRSLSHLIQPHEPHLFSFLKQGGYYTDIIGKNDLFSETIVPDYVPSYKQNHIKPSHFPTPKYDGEDPKYYSFQYNSTTGGVYEKDQYFIDQAVRFLSNPPQEPFVLFVTINLPHPGYVSHTSLDHVLAGSDIEHMKPPIQSGKPLFHDGIRSTRNLDLLSDMELREIKATYYKMCLMVDQYLGQLLDAYDPSTTTFILTSDHGDYQGNYGLVEKWPSACEEDIINVPLMMAGPSIPSNTIVEKPVELLDVMATILDLTGVEATEAHFSKSVLPLLHDSSYDHREYVFTEGGYDENEPYIFEGQKLGSKQGMYYPKAFLQQSNPNSVCRFVSVRNNQYKLVLRTQDVDELYDLKTDPDELSNVIDQPTYQAVIDAMKQAILDWYIRTSDISPTTVDRRGFPTT